MSTTTTTITTTSEDDFVLVEGSEVPSSSAPTAEISSTTTDDSAGATVPDTPAPVAEKLLDLVFVMDCTGSMGQYIDNAKQNIEKIVTEIIKAESCDVRFGLVAYRDHPPQDNTYVTMSYEFVTSTNKMSENLAGLSAEGGGDGPEALTAGLFAAKGLKWREKSAKVVVLIADAPPHGLGESGDGFPDGDPDGLDPLVLAREMSNMGIAIYSVGCEPALSSYRFTRAFLISLSEITGGKAVCLASAALLANVILGGAAEELGIQMLASQMKNDIDTLREEVRGSSSGFGCASRPGGLSEEGEKVLLERMERMFAERGVKMTEMETDGEMKDTALTPTLLACADLSDVRGKVQKIPRSTGDVYGFTSGGGFGGGIVPAPAASHCRLVRDAAPSYESSARVYRRFAASKEVGK